MRCDSAELIGAYIDQELAPEARREMAAHLETCPACVALTGDIRHISGKLAALGRALAPEDLEARVRARLAIAEAETMDRPRLAVWGERLQRGWIFATSAMGHLSLVREVAHLRFSARFFARPHFPARRIGIKH